MSDAKTDASATTRPLPLRLLRWLDQNLEKIVILIAYSTMAGIICVEVIRRFLFNVQAPWSTSIPVLLFLWVTWVGAAYNVKQRTHLSLNEVRLRLPYTAQFCCLILDTVLWLIFAAIVIYFSIQQVTLAYDNFAIVQGTDNVMQWWFYLATPVGWSLIVYRVLVNFYQDWQTFRRRDPFNLQPSLLE